MKKCEWWRSDSGVVNCEQLQTQMVFEKRGRGGSGGRPIGAITKVKKIAPSRLKSYRKTATTGLCAQGKQLA